MYSKEQNPPGTSFGLEPAEIHCVLAVFCVHLVGANCWDTQVHQFRTLSQFSSVQLLSRVRPFATPWTAAHQASLSITNSWSLLKLMSIESVMPPIISSSVVPFSSYLQSFPASGSFQMSQLFASDGQSIGVSASTLVLPVNT